MSPAGPDAAFHWNGLGLLPYKDTFISNRTSAQRSGQSWTNETAFWPSFAGYQELGAATHALMSLLSMAHVTFSDAVGETNKTLIDQLIRADGVLLKADRPATAIDAQFQAMMFGAWPGQDPGPGETPGSLYTMPCDGNNAGQRWNWTAIAGSGGARVLAVAGGGCLDVAEAGCKAGAAVAGAAVRVRSCDEATPCRTQQWALVAKMRGAKGYTLQSGANHSLCVQLENGGGNLFECDANAVQQAWLLGAPTAMPTAAAAAAARNRGLPRPFTLMTPVHDDALCLTAAPLAARGRGAFSFDGKETKDSLARELFPGGDGVYSPLSAQYKDAYTMSEGLMRSIKERDEKAQCAGRPLGAPQGPLGEVYSTHTTVSGMTWRYVVGVQLPEDYGVTPHDVNLDFTAAHSAYVSYEYNHAKPGFRPDSVVKIAAGAASVAELRANAGEWCKTRPGLHQTTRCFAFQLHAIAPVARNGWALLGETGKFIPVSRQRIASVTAIPSGGFAVMAKGKPGERVEIGAVDAAASKFVYVAATIGADGTASISVI